MNVGYTTGVFDLFHIGHLNLLRNARALCDKLIVGVSTDDLVGYKNKRAIIPFSERIEIVRAIDCVDAAIVQEDMDKFGIWQKLKFDTMFVGDDWFQTEKWKELDEQFSDAGVKIIYIPYTKGVSSTLINETLSQLRSEDH